MASVGAKGRKRARFLATVCSQDCTSGHPVLSNQLQNTDFVVKLARVPPCVSVVEQELIHACLLTDEYIFDGHRDGRNYIMELRINHFHFRLVRLSWIVGTENTEAEFAVSEDRPSQLGTRRCADRDKFLLPGAHLQQ
jgi:hypothetical protein